MDCERFELVLARRLSPLPVSPVEKAGRLERRRIDPLQAASVDADLVGIRARHVKGVDAAMPAECVLRGIGVELVGREIRLALQ